MQTSFSAQFSRLGLSGFRVEKTPLSNEAHDSDAVDQTLLTLWSNLFCPAPRHRLERRCLEDRLGVVDLCYRAAIKRAAQVDRATDDIRLLLASADGSEVRTCEIEHGPLDLVMTRAS